MTKSLRIGLFIVPALLVVLCLPLFAACGNQDLIDLGGSYEEISADNLQESKAYQLMSSLDTMDVPTGYEMKYMLEVGGNKMEITGHAQATMEGTEVTGMKMMIEAYVNGEDFDQNYDGSMYIEITSAGTVEAYLNNNGTKTKITSLNDDPSGALGAASSMSPESIMEIFDRMGGSGSDNMIVSFAEERNAQKIKVTLNEKPEGVTQLEMYIIFDGEDNFRGIAFKAQGEMPTGPTNETATVTYDIQLAVSDEEVKAPSDLDSYVEA